MTGEGSDSTEIAVTKELKAVKDLLRFTHFETLGSSYIGASFRFYV